MAESRSLASKYSPQGQQLTHVTTIARGGTPERGRPQTGRSRLLWEGRGKQVETASAGREGLSAGYLGPSMGGAEHGLVREWRERTLAEFTSKRAINSKIRPRFLVHAIDSTMV